MNLEAGFYYGSIDLEITTDEPNSTIRYTTNGNAPFFGSTLYIGSLTISNTGSQLTINPKRLFDRFSKANPSSKSLGLGLSIIKKICELYKWQINYSVNNNWHQITVRF